MCTPGFRRFEHYATYVDFRHRHPDLVPSKAPQSSRFNRKRSSRRATHLVDFLPRGSLWLPQRDELREFRLVSLEAFAEVLALGEKVSELSACPMERHVLTKRPRAEDMLIAATALSRGEGLATGNAKHFGFVPGLMLKLFRP